ncbi:hypothetical protein [Lactobacillus taiwanensis]|uniref:hypothetical protein n=1 Tax=Lactobacillus taiwanensis TaxID=508451 RepID=UPI00248CE90D|nr:hypothetical protein [Lactobacillus taiwanensis]
MGFYVAKPKKEIIDKLKKEKDWYWNKIISIDAILSNDTDISEKQLYLIDKQSKAMNKICNIIDKRIADLKAK